MGELAMALAVAQEMGVAAKPVPTAATLIGRLDRDLVTVLSRPPDARPEPRLWPQGFDGVIRALATLALKGDRDRVQELKDLYVDLEARVRDDVETLFRNDVEVAQLRSWLDALTLVFEEDDSRDSGAEKARAAAAAVS